MKKQKFSCMNRFKLNKPVIFLSLFAVSGVIFSSCDERSSHKHTEIKKPDATLTLALRSGTYADVIRSCLPEFELKFNVLCKTVDFSEGALHTSIATDKAGSYDLCMVDGSWMAEYAAKGVLANLSELGYELDNDVIPATTKICYQNDSLYLAPYYGNVTVLLYNKLMIKEAGYKPEDINSLEDLLTICRFQEKRHNLGFMYRGDTPNNIVVDFLPILLSRGTYVVDENNNPTINTDEFSEAIYLYKSLIKTGRAAKKEDLIAAVANKSAALGIGWPGWYTPTRNSSMDYIALTGRYREDRPAFNSNIYGIWTIGIPESSRNKKYAVELLRYLMDKDVQKATVKAGGVPCRYSSLKDEKILADFPQYEAVCKALEGGVYRPVMVEWSKFYTILGREMKLMIDGSKTVPEGLETAQKDLEKMLKESNN